MLMVDEELLRNVGAEEHGIFFVNRDGTAQGHSGRDRNCQGRSRSQDC